MQLLLSASNLWMVMARGYRTFCCWYATLYSRLLFGYLSNHCFLLRVGLPTTQQTIFATVFMVNVRLLMLQLQPVDDKEVLVCRLLKSHLFLAHIDGTF